MSSCCSTESYDGQHDVEFYIYKIVAKFNNKVYSSYSELIWCLCDIVPTIVIVSCCFAHVMEEQMYANASHPPIPHSLMWQ